MINRKIFSCTLFFLILCSFSLFSQQSLTAKQQSFPTTKATDKITYKIIDAGNNTFGYDIISNGKPMIRQTTIPGLSGNEGFKTKQQAENVAKLAIEKINKGAIPPSITIEELKQLKAIK